MRHYCAEERSRNHEAFSDPALLGQASRRFPFLSMARGRRFRRGGAAKSQTEAEETKPVEESVEIHSKDVLDDQEVLEEAVEEPVGEKPGAADAEETDEQEETLRSEVEKTANTKETLKETRKKQRGKKGKKPAAPESGQKEKKKIDIAGLIFMCNTATKKDCFKYRVFGLPEAKKDIVEQVKKGIKLFLFDIDRRVLYGIYKASSEGGINLMEEAFKDSNRKFPAQVRFRIHKDCMPLEENVFKQAIKENYFRGNKFKCELNIEQVGKLMQLFRPLDSRGLPMPKPGKDAKREPAFKSNTPRGSARTPRTRGLPPRGAAPVRTRERVYPREYAPLYPRERLPTEMDLRLQPSYVPLPDVAQAEAEALYRQRFQLRQMQEAQLDALDRRAYALDPVLVDASVAGRKRYLEDVYAEQQGLVLKRPLLQDHLYRDSEYQREIPYRSYGDGLHALSGALPYESSVTQLAWPR